MRIENNKTCGLIYGRCEPFFFARALLHRNPPDANRKNTKQIPQIIGSLPPNICVCVCLCASNRLTVRHSLCLFLRPPTFHSVQHSRAAQGEVARCSALATRQRELRVLRAGQNAAAARCHHQPAGQGVHHSADHQLPEAARLQRPRRPAVGTRSVAGQQGTEM